MTVEHHSGLGLSVFSQPEWDVRRETSCTPTDEYEGDHDYFHVLMRSGGKNLSSSILNVRDEYRIGGYTKTVLPVKLIAKPNKQHIAARSLDVNCMQTPDRIRHVMFDHNCLILADRAL